MREIVVISGKGGTGKTSVSASLASLAKDSGVVMCDCDVDAPDLWLLTPPRDQIESPFMGMDGACIDQSSCVGCGKCADFCRFGAIEIKGGKSHVLDYRCEGCGGCSIVCPLGAVSMVKRQQGRWFKAKTDLGPLVYARLFPGGENSGMLVTAVRRQARDMAEKNRIQTIITDGPPGIACPAIAAVTGASLALAVTEPTASGLTDLRRIRQVAEKLSVPMAVVLNKSTLTSMAPEIKAACQDMGTPLIGEIPFSRAVPEAVSRGSVPLKEMSPAVQSVWERIKDMTA